MGLTTDGIRNQRIKDMDDHRPRLTIEINRLKAYRIFLTKLKISAVADNYSAEDIADIDADRLDFKTRLQTFVNTI